MKGLINFPGPWVSLSSMLEWEQLFFFLSVRDNHNNFFLNNMFISFLSKRTINFVRSLSRITIYQKEASFMPRSFLPIILCFPSHCVPWCKVWQNRWPFPHPKKQGQTAESHFVCGRPHTKKRLDTTYQDDKCFNKISGLWSIFCLVHLNLWSANHIFLSLISLGQGKSDSCHTS